MSQQIQVSANHRFLQYADGRPFFWLGDTVWELFHRADRSDANLYLRDRAAKGFTVVQAVVLAEFEGLTLPNPYGHLPLVDMDPTQPVEAYFEHVDHIVHLAGSLGVTVAMLPTWGDKWNKAWGNGPVIFTPENARVFGEFLGKRYKDSNVIWVLGGDRPIEHETHRPILDAMAAGLKTGHSGTQLTTFHPCGGRSSAMDLHDAEWLDFNMWQSGHDRNRGNYDCITEDYNRLPVKPCLDAEPGYEDHTASFNIDNGYLDDYDCRKSLYWALFAGAFGHTYGCHPIWQLADGTVPPHYTNVRTPWRQALHLPGASQMQFAKRLLLSRPFFSRIPDQSMVVAMPESRARRVQATRDSEGSYALIYFATPEKATLDLSSLRSPTVNATWYDPRRGLSVSAPTLVRSSSVEIEPPSFGPDWVLILDDPSAGYQHPG